MAPETTCSKCMYVDYPHDEFPCDICLNSGKLVENMVEPNWAPPGAVLAEKKPKVDCDTCRFDGRPLSSYPCFRCLHSESPTHWEPEEEKVETPKFDSNPFKFNYRMLFGAPRFGKTFVTSSVLDGVGITYATVPAPKPFWIVCADAGNLYATVRHETEKSATDEANRLALKTGKTFQVFKSVAKVTGKTTANQEKYA